MSALPPTNGNTTARPRVIVIDDDPLFRNLITSSLRKDYFVSVASEGSEGYYKAIEHPPDIAVIDVQMPGWDGLKTLRAFRAHAQLAHAVIVMLTSDASRETVIAAIQGGANDYVIKTKFSREEFLAKLERLLKNRQAADGPAPLLQPPHAPISSPHSSPTKPGSVAAGVAAAVVTGQQSDLQAALDAWE